MKVRFDGLDVTAMVAHLSSTLTGRRIVNVYDGDSGESYVFKLDGSDNKAFLLVESGIRLHPLRHYVSDSPMPSPFCSKLRKHLRGLRLEQVQQISTDRVVLFNFGVGQSRHTLVLELYAKGNLILTDRDYKILALLRSHVYNSTANDEKKKNDNEKKNDTKQNPAGDNENDGKGNDQHQQQKQSETVVAVQVGHVYPVSYATTMTGGTGTGSTENSAAAATDDNEKKEEDDDKTTTTTTGILSDNYMEWINQEIQSQKDHDVNTAQMSKRKKKKKQKALTLKTLLLKPNSGISQYGPALIEHCILKANLEPHEPLLDLDLSENQWESLRTTLRVDGDTILQNVGTSDAYILYEPREKNTTSKADDTGNDNQETKDNNDIDSDLPHADKILQQFFPYLFLQYANKPLLTYDNFGTAVADFYAQLSRQKQLLKAQAAENAASAKLEKIRVDQQDRLVSLEKEQVQLQKEAQATQQNADNVDKALIVVNSALDSGMDWDQLEQLVEVEQQKQNPIAMLIQELDLENDSMILRLPINGDDDDSDSNPYLDVRISLKESAHANANTLFAKYRASKEKAAKTIEASSVAMKAAEESAMRQLAEAQKRTKITPIAKRKPAWYEKFHWFISSDNYLVLGGKDAHQNEQLVKRYLRPGDAYLHADVHGAASCILRAKRRRRSNKSGGGNKTEPVPLSEQALREAGNFTICRSSAWTSRMVTSAWWVEADQVSKTAPTGEYLTVGSFMVRGKKNFLPPSQLEMGLAVLFRLGDEDSIARHKNDRRDFALMALESSIDDDDDDDEVAVGSATGGEKDKSKDVAKKTNNKANNAAVSEGSSKASSAADEKDTEDTNEASAEPAGTGGDSHLDSSERSEGDPLPGESPSEVLTGNNGSTAKSSQQRKGLSARDRRLIKKHGSLEEAERVLASQKQDKNPIKNNEKDPIPPANSSNEPNQQQCMKRGKKAKMKRAMKKYGDQDEEDKELAMLALQGGEKAKKTERQGESITETQRIVAAETTALLVKDASEAASQLPDTVRSILSECVKVKSGDDEDVIRWDKFDADTLEQLAALEEEAQVTAAKRLLQLKTSTRIDNFAASLSGIIRTIRKFGHERLNAELNNDLSADNAKRKTKEEKEAEEKTWKQTLAQEGVAAGDSDNEDDAVDDTTELNKMTGKPHADDLLLYAVPVCAPYNVLSQYSYRVKLTPGNMKRGKAAKQCVEMLLRGDNSKAAPKGGNRGNELIKKITDNDWVHTIMADVKLAAPGAAKMAKKSKSNQKAKAKNNKKKGK